MVSRLADAASAGSRGRLDAAIELFVDAAVLDAVDDQSRSARKTPATATPAFTLLQGAVLSGCAAVVMLAGTAASALVLDRVATALLVCAGVCAGLAAALTAAWRRTPRSSDAPRR